MLLEPVSAKQSRLGDKLAVELDFDVELISERRLCYNPWFPPPVIILGPHQDQVLFPLVVAGGHVLKVDVHVHQLEEG